MENTINKKIEWVEKQAAENLRFRLQNCEILAKEANSLLTILLTAIGAMVAYSIKTFPENSVPDLLLGAIITTIWLMLIAVILVVKCVVTSEITPTGNEPNNLLLDDYSLEEIRKFELDNVQESINKVSLRNKKTAYWLDLCRKAAIASPLLFILGAAWVHLLGLFASVCARAA